MRDPTWCNMETRASNRRSSTSTKVSILQASSSHRTKSTLTPPLELSIRGTQCSTPFGKWWVLVSLSLYCFSLIKEALCKVILCNDIVVYLLLTHPTADFFSSTRDQESWRRVGRSSGRYQTSWSIGFIWTAALRWSGCSSSDLEKAQLF